MEEAKRLGLESYLTNLSRKSEILDTLLENWDNGRLKSFFCLAVNLLPLKDLEDTMSKLNQTKEKLESESNLAPKDIETISSKLAKDALTQIAAAQGIELKLRR